MLKMTAPDVDLCRDFDDFLHTAAFTTKHLKGHEGYAILIPAWYWPDVLPFTSSFKLHDAPGGQTDAAFAKCLLSAFAVAGLAIGYVEGVSGWPYEFLGLRQYAIPSVFRATKFAKRHFLPALKAAANASKQSPAVSKLEQDYPVMLIKGSEKVAIPRSALIPKFQGHEGTAIHIPSQYLLQLLAYISSVNLDELAPKQKKGGALAGFVFATTLTAMFIFLVWALESLDSIIYFFCTSSYVTLGKAVDTMEFAILQATVILSLYLLTMTRLQYVCTNKASFDTKISILSFSPDGLHLAIATGMSVVVLNAEGHPEITLDHHSVVLSIVWADDDSFVSGYQNGTIFFSTLTFGDDAEGTHRDQINWVSNTPRQNCVSHSAKPDSKFNGGSKPIPITDLDRRDEIQ
ncbi:hypothetical protein IW261DRAFT_1426214 [Armillaria novae-zelandiae]|uniref:Uncharacterized protein n=1 Tax=Armillaria novae-zelandiae TaxID=153914 RepID=A0AA39U198_9AGAR|nr:hypothetical protein IW261DRAFT_1426214 [Armillaria novae-zelandiae]